MYRKGLIEQRRAALTARSRVAAAVRKRIRRGMSKGRALELETRLAALAGRATETTDALQALEAEVDALDAMVRVLDAEWAEHGVLGAPPTGAEAYAADWFLRHVDEHDPALTRVLVALDAGAARVAAELPSPPLLDLRMPVACLYFHEGGLPFRAEISADTTDTPGEQVPRVRIQIAISPRYARVAARPQRLGDDVLGVLRLRTDPTFDDPAFDGAYFVTGEQPHLAGIFTPPVRRQMVALAREMPASLEVEGGVASILFERPQRLRTVCKVLGAIRKNTRRLGDTQPPPRAGHAPRR